MGEGLGLVDADECPICEQDPELEICMTCGKGVEKLAERPKEGDGRTDQSQ